MTSGVTLASAGGSASRGVSILSTSVGRIASVEKGCRTGRGSGVSEGTALASRRCAGDSELGVVSVNSDVSSINALGGEAVGRDFGEGRIGEDASLEIASALGSVCGRTALPIRGLVLDPLLSRRDMEATPNMMTVAAPMTAIKRRWRNTPALATGLLRRPVVTVSVWF
jgi:hypothetical protein